MTGSRCGLLLFSFGHAFTLLLCHDEACRLIHNLFTPPYI